MSRYKCSESALPLEADEELIEDALELRDKDEL